MNLEEFLEELRGLGVKEAWGKELYLKSEYYCVTLICLHIKDIQVIDGVLMIWLDNRRVYEFKVTDDLEYNIRDRFDLNLIETGVPKIRRLHQRNA